jgi:hypothetical protein
MNQRTSFNIGMISAAALHLAYLHPDQRGKYELLSTQHQDIALGPFRAAMLNIALENCNQVFAFSLLLIVSHFAASRSTEFFAPSLRTTVYNKLANWVV